LLWCGSIDKKKEEVHRAITERDRLQQQQTETAADITQSPSVTALDEQSSSSWSEFNRRTSSLLGAI